MPVPNPYTLSFGKVPNEYIPRREQTQRIISTFDAEPAADQLYVVVGVRGTGKTVQMNEIFDHYSEDSNWITLKINPQDNILASVYGELYHNKSIYPMIKSAHISASISAGPVSVEIAKNNDEPPLSQTSKVSRMLQIAKKQKKKVLITLDEISNTPQMAEFASALQIFISDHQPVYLLGTALYENLKELADKKNLSFLYRAPRIYLDPLDLNEISLAYQKSFNIDEQQAAELAKLTKGYSFAFQALGYICWEHKGNIHVKNILNEFDAYLREYSYKKIWRELSDMDRKVAVAISQHEGEKVKVIRQACSMESYEFSPYRARLQDKGLIDTSTYGKISFTLPRFSIFIKNQMIYDE